MLNGRARVQRYIAVGSETNSGNLLLVPLLDSDPTRNCVTIRPLVWRPTAAIYSLSSLDSDPTRICVTIRPLVRRPTAAIYFLSSLDSDPMRSCVSIRPLVRRPTAAIYSWCPRWTPIQRELCDNKAVGSKTNGDNLLRRHFSQFKILV